MASLSSLTASLLADVTAATRPLTRRQVTHLVKKHKLPGTVGGRGTSWTIEVKNEREKREVEKVLGELGGFMTGYGGWVLSQDYKSKGDWGEKSSPHHYASDGGLTAQEFAAKVDAGTPSKLKKWTKAKAFSSVGSMVAQIDFSYTESKDGADRLNANNFRILVQGWPKEGQGVKVTATAVRSHGVPKLRKKTGPPEKVAQYLINWMKKNEAAMVEGEPHKRKSASKKVKVKGKDLKPGDKLPGPGGKGVFEVTKVGPGPGKMLRVRGKSVNDIMMMKPDDQVEVTRKSASVADLTAELRSVTAAAMPPAALAAAKKWSARLSDAQRKLAGKLAKDLKRSGFSTGMFKDFASLGLKSLNMESFLRMGQMPKAKLQRIVDQTVEMLEMGAAAAHDKYAGDWPHQADSHEEPVRANTEWPVKVSFRGTKQPWFKDRMYDVYRGNLTVALGTSSERSEVEFVASRGGMRHVKAPKMPYSIAEAAVFALLKNRAL